MKLGNPIKISDSIYQLRVLGSRVTVILNGKEIILVDTGIKGSLSYISSGLNSLVLSIDQIRLIVISHHHPDHSGELGKLARATSAKIAVHSMDADVIRGKEAAPNPYVNQIVAKITAPLIKKLYSNPVEVDYDLQDGDLLPVGNNIKVIHTPGHTAGSICLHVTDQKLIIAGDALQYKFRKLGFPSKSVTENFHQATTSLDKLIKIDFDTICFSHFPPLRYEAHSSLNRLLQK